jgi:leucyl-tRNA synthetase
MYDITEKTRNAYEKFVSLSLYSPLASAEPDMPWLRSFRTWYKEALQYGFYELDNARRAYTETTSDIGMHHDIFMEYLRRVALLSAPIIPHFAEHIWSTVLQSSTSIQNALFPEPHAVDKTVLASLEYMRTTIKDIRDKQIALDKAKAKAKKGVGKAGQVGAPIADREKPLRARLYVAKSWPEWQNKIVAAIKDNYDESTGQVDDGKVREALTAEGLLKNKKAMPYVMGFKVRLPSSSSSTPP